MSITAGIPISGFNDLNPLIGTEDFVVRSGTTNYRLNYATMLTKISSDLGVSNPLTTDGDLLYYDSGDTRLPIGSEDQFLRVSSGLPVWETVTFLSDPTTTNGDIIWKDGGVLTRLPIGSVGEVLTVAVGGTDIEWGTGSTYVDPLTTRGDILIRDASQTTRLPIGTDGQVLTADSSGDALWQDLQSTPLSSTGDILTYSGGSESALSIGTTGQFLTVSSGGLPEWSSQTIFSDPLTTDGDVIIRSSGTTTRLPIGTQDEVLAVSVGGEPVWVDIPSILSITDLLAMSSTAANPGASEDEFVLTWDNDTSQYELKNTVSSGPSFGSNDQLPFMNLAGTDFDYSSNLTFDGTTLTVNGNISEVDQLSGPSGTAGFSFTSSSVDMDGDGVFSFSGDATIVLPSAPSSTTTGSLRYNGGNFQVYDGGWNTVGGSSISFGADNEIPITNSTTDDFDYDSGFLYDGIRLLAEGTSTDSVSIGTQAEANSTNGVSIGVSAGRTTGTVGASYIAIGNSAGGGGAVSDDIGADSVLIGRSTRATMANNVVIGTNGRATASRSGIINLSTTTETNSLANSFEININGSTHFKVGSLLGTQILSNADPDTNLTSAVDGVVAYDSTSHDFRGYIDGTWETLAARRGTQNSSSPTLTSTGGGETVGYSTNTCTWYEIGDLVSFRVVINVNSLSGGSGNTQVNIPTMPPPAIGFDAHVRWSNIDLSTNYTFISIILSNNAGSIDTIFSQSGDNNAIATVPWADIANNTQISFSGTYIKA